MSSSQQPQYNSIISNLNKTTETAPFSNLSVYTNYIQITDELMEQALEKGTLPEGEDGNRSEATRIVHRTVGELGELAFKHHFNQQTKYSIEHRGGKTEPDFVISQPESQTEASIDVKTRMTLASFKTDLIAKGDLPDGLHRYYFLQYVDWDETVKNGEQISDHLELDTDDKKLIRQRMEQRMEQQDANNQTKILDQERERRQKEKAKSFLEKINGIVIAGWVDDTIVDTKGKQTQFATISGQQNANNRTKLLVEKPDIKPLHDFSI
jgi:hypothetical protein